MWKYCRIGSIVWIDNFGTTKMGYSCREALLKTIKTYKIESTELSRRTEVLERRGKGKMVRPDQLSRYLRGKKDLMSEGQETLICALDEEHRNFYLSLVATQWSGQTHLVNKEQIQQIIEKVYSEFLLLKM